MLNDREKKRSTCRFSYIRMIDHFKHIKKWMLQDYATAIKSRNVNLIALCNDKRNSIIRIYICSLMYVYYTIILFNNIFVCDKS